MTGVEVLNYKWERLTVPAEIIREYYPMLKSGLPLAPGVFSFEIKGVFTSVANAIRRTLMDEIPGQALVLKRDGFVREETSDLFMDFPFISLRLRNIPIRSDVDARSAEFGLRVYNDSSSQMLVYAGDLTPKKPLKLPLFNPTFPIAILQPGKSIRLEGIVIEEGLGRNNSCFNPVIRAALEPLDVAKRTAPPNERTPLEDLSIYEPSVFTAKPKHFKISGTVPAADGEMGRELVRRACKRIITRLESANDALQDDRKFLATPFREGSVMGKLRLPEETDTLMNIITQGAVEWHGAHVLNAGYEKKQELDEMVLEIVTEGVDIVDVITDTIDQLKKIFQSISAQMK